MGQKLCRCTRKQKSADFTPVETRDPADDDKEKNKNKSKDKKDKKKKKKKKCKGKKSEAMEDNEPFQWERELLEKKLMGSGFVTHAVIVSSADGTVKASSPKDFVPDSQGIKDILSALNGDATNIAEGGIVLLGDGEENTPSLGPFTPGKMEDGKSIYASDGQGSGCTVQKTKSSVLITVHDKNPDAAIRLTSEVAEYMIQNDR